MKLMKYGNFILRNITASSSLLHLDLIPLGKCFTCYIFSCIRNTALEKNTA